MALGLSIHVECQENILNAEIVNGTTVRGLSSVNTEYLEFSPVMYNDGLVYVSSKEKGDVFDPEINESFFDLKYFALNSESASAVDFSPVINTTNVHKGPCAFSQQERIIYFTKERRFSDGKDAVLKIFKAYKDENAWIPDGEFPYNSDEYSNMHPAVSPDGSFMIFSSNQDGGTGGYDLYISKYVNGYWQQPKSLGSSVNSKENELFPFVHSNGSVFYSSDGKGGEGKLDLFVTQLQDDGNWAQAVNVGGSFNSSADDFGISINDEGNYGFLTSNRKGGIGKDDIYEFQSESSIFTEEKETSLVARNVDNLFQFSTRVLDRKTKLPIKDVEVYAFPFVVNEDQIILSYFNIKSIDAGTDKDNIIMNLVPRSDISAQFLRLSDENGLASFVLDRNKRYFLLSQTDGYEKTQTAINALNIIPEITLLMEKEEESLTESPPATIESANARVENALDRGELVVFNQIFYDYNSYEIKAGAMRELDLLVNYLSGNPDLRVQLTSYTDARGEREYNQILSGERAQSAKAYLVKNGISDFRIIAVGQGENNIRNHCSNGVICTDEEHEYNRRTEVQILEY